MVATYGRGFWVMDDVTPLQQMTESVLAAEAHLFAPRATYRFRNRPGIQSQPDDPAAGENPNAGAAINFYLREVPEDSVKLEIVDADGGIVGALRTDPLERGLNRAYWNLMERPSKEARIRTKPVEHAHAEMPEEGWRDLPDGGRVRPLAPPGVYTVRLSLDEQVLEQPLEIIKDPNSEGSLADIQEQVGLMREIRDAADSTVALVDRIEWTRAQLVLLTQTTAEHEEAEAISELIEALESELRDIEMLIFDLRMSGGSAGQDSLRWPRRLYARLTSLAGWIGQSDHRPTDQAREVFAMLQSELRDLQARAAAVEREEVMDLNRFLQDRGIGPIVLR